MSDDREYSEDPNNPANQSQMERDMNRWARTAPSGKVVGAVVAMPLLEIVVLGAIAWGISRLLGLHDTGLVIYWVAMGVLIFWFVLGRKLKKIKG